MHWILSLLPVPGEASHEGEGHGMVHAVRAEPAPKGGQVSRTDAIGFPLNAAAAVQAVRERDRRERNTRSQVCDIDSPP